VAHGSLVPIAASGKERSSKLPHVPTFAESNVPELKNWTYTGWIGFVAAEGIPADASTKLQTALTASMQSPKVKEAFDAIGFKVIASNAQQFRSQIQEGLEVNRKIMESANIKK
jgi:tripartite-type tricarboxylate transporter receptor subunit TctC